MFQGLNREISADARMKDIRNMNQKMSCTYFSQQRIQLRSLIQSSQETTL